MKQRVSKQVVGSLGMVGIGLVLGAGQAGAQLANITAQATVTLSCSLTVTAAGSYNNLNLSSAQTNVTVGTAVENCNDRKGYVVTISSKNGTSTGILKGKSYTQTLAYGVDYGSTTTLTFAGSTATATSTNKTGFTTHTIGVSYAAGPHLTADTYTDTLTFTMTTN